MSDIQSYEAQQSPLYLMPDHVEADHVGGLQRPIHLVLSEQTPVLPAHITVEILGEGIDRNGIADEPHKGIVRAGEHRGVAEWANPRGIVRTPEDTPAQQGRLQRTASKLGEVI